MDPHSEAKLQAVHPELARRVHQLADMYAAAGFPAIIVVQGLRTYSEQDALYAQGRTAPGRVVTKARGGWSMHNYGLAVDLTPDDPDLPGFQPDWSGNDARWQKMLALALTCGLAEGAQWRSFPDTPHFYPQELPATPTDAMRQQFQAGGIQKVWDSLNLTVG